MRKIRNLLGIGLLSAALAIGAVACDDDEDNGDGDGNGAPISTEPADGGETPSNGGEETPEA